MLLGVESGTFVPLLAGTASALGVEGGGMARQSSEGTNLI